VNWKKWGLIIVLLSLIWIWQQWPDGKLRVVFCDVGQGDASLIVLGPFQALIDTGPSEEKLLNCLGKEIPFWDRKIDLVFISHPQFDHNGALSELKQRYNIGKLVEKAEENDIYRYKELYFDILQGGNNTDNQLNQSENSENEDSMVVMLRYLNNLILFTADIDEKTELALLDKGVLKKINVLKVPHHGSKFSSSILFLEKLRPGLAVVSVGAKNSYGHPSSDTLMRLELVKAKILRTDLSGSIEVIFGSENFQIFTDR